MPQLWLYKQLNTASTWDKGLKLNHWYTIYYHRSWHTFGLDQEVLHWKIPKSAEVYKG